MSVSVCSEEKLLLLELLKMNKDNLPLQPQRAFRLQTKNAKYPQYHVARSGLTQIEAHENKLRKSQDQYNISHANTCGHDI